MCHLNILRKPTTKISETKWGIGRGIKTCEEKIVCEIVTDINLFIFFSYIWALFGDWNLWLSLVAVDFLHLFVFSHRSRRRGNSLCYVMHFMEHNLSIDSLERREQTEKGEKRMLTIYIWSWKRKHTKNVTNSAGNASVSLANTWILPSH